MQTRTYDRRADAIPVIIAIIIAVLGIAGILFEDFGPGDGSRGNADARMITAAAVFRAGAIQIPSKPASQLASKAPQKPKA